jgi:4-amino-4-deoxy-L-arabinose transferase-like glycosyltransferase
MWPFDSASTVTIAVAAVCLAGAAVWKARVTARLALVVLAALVLRVDAARQESIHAWDERFHAVVAKNLISHPLTPTLYDKPLSADPRAHWTEAHVWLHKPPLALWMMAASMSAFGVNALAMRLPSVLASALGVVLTFAIGRRLFNERVGLVAAGLQAVNGLLVNLASGRRVADHVDTALITMVELAVYLSIAAGTRLPPWRALLAGIAVGAAVLAKSFPALAAVPVALVFWWASESASAAGVRLLWLAIGAAATAGPWLIYTRLAFPVEAAQEQDYMLRHITTVMENHGGVWWSYFNALPRIYGELVAIPVIWFAIRAVTRADGRPAAAAMLTWFMVPYVVFSLMATKLPAFVATAAPALFLMQAVFWCHLRDRLPNFSGWTRRFAIVLLALLALLPARQLLEVTGPLEIRDRFPTWTREMMALRERLGVEDAVIFNMPRAIEVMFYSPYIAYTRMPADDEVRMLRTRGIPIVIYEPAGTTVAVPAAWGALVLRGRFE